MEQRIFLLEEWASPSTSAISGTRVDPFEVCGKRKTVAMIVFDNLSNGIGLASCEVILIGSTFQLKSLISFPRFSMQFLNPMNNLRIYVHLFVYAP